MQRKVIVCMPIYREWSLLKAHLDTYPPDVVDRFIVSEAPWDCHNHLQPKPLGVPIFLASHPQYASRVLFVPTGSTPLNSGYVNECTDAWTLIHRDLRPSDVGSQVIVSPYGPVYTVIYVAPTGQVHAHSHLTPTKVDDIQGAWKHAQTSGQAFVKKTSWSADEMDSLAQKVQRNFVDLQLGHVGHEMKLQNQDILLFVEPTEFVDPNLLRAFKMGTWTATNADEFALPQGDYAVSLPDQTTRPSDLDTTKWGQCGLPFPTVAGNKSQFYGAQLVLTWNIFSATRQKKARLWGQYEESAVITTWGAYNRATPMPGTFGRRAPAHFRTRDPAAPPILKIGFRPDYIDIPHEIKDNTIWPTCGWYMDWLQPSVKAASRAGLNKEQLKNEEAWVRHCVTSNLEPEPLVTTPHWTSDQEHPLDRTQPGQYATIPRPIRALH